MKLCYQAATPDVAIADSVTAYQGTLDQSFGGLSRLGYDGVELMTLNPGALDWKEVKQTADKYGLNVVLVCTGEIFRAAGAELYKSGGRQPQGGHPQKQGNH